MFYVDQAYLGQGWIGFERREKTLRFNLSLLNSVANTSGVRLVAGRLGLIIAAPSSTQRCRMLRATPTCHVELWGEGNTRALVRIPRLDPGQTFESRIEVEFVTSTQTFPLGQSVQTAESPDEFCRRDKFWETSDPLIGRTAKKIRASSEDTADFVASTYAWVRENVKLRDPQPARLGAARTIRERTGDCDELSDLFIALCRTENVPCRRVVGLFYQGEEGAERPFEWHAWAEVRAGKDTWIPFDPSLGFLASISERHIARCCMGRRSEYPVRRLTWRSPSPKPSVLNEDDVEGITLLSG